MLTSLRAMPNRHMAGVAQIRRRDSGTDGPAAADILHVWEYAHHRNTGSDGRTAIYRERTRAGPRRIAASPCNSDDRQPEILIGNAFIIVNGRRWRASDPGIPPNFRQELVNELMSARRAVRDGKNALDIRNARRRVNDAKLALGERGDAWWLPPTSAATRRRVDAAMRALLRSRQPDRSICPSDVARIVGGASWRTLLPVVRDRAVVLMEKGELRGSSTA
jgi:hypothetical protein